MNEKLIIDYMNANDLGTYLPEGSIEQISIAGEWVMFSERSSCGYYAEQHMISLFDIVAWVYSDLLDYRRATF